MDIVQVCNTRHITLVVLLYMLGSFFSREHDKNPETFFKVLVQLQEAGCDFRLYVLGENFKDNPGKLWGAR